MAPQSLGAAKAASDEATKKTRVFVWKYTVEVEKEGGEPGEMITEDRQLDLVIPKKYKRLKFAKYLASGNILDALELVFGAEAAEELEELDMDDDEFDLFMERLGHALGGTNAKN
jgi:hypothetical protein